jgi:hypothetical protein
MASVETTADAQLVGLGRDAETQLAAAWLERRRRMGDGLVIVLLVAVQAAWFSSLLYAAYFFIAH